MNLRADFTRDLGFLDFKDSVGPDALEYIFNLGARCQIGKATTLQITDRHFGRALGLADGVDAMEAKDALIRNGMIRPLPEQDTYEITVFIENNGGLIANWGNGAKGGRPRVPKDAAHKRAEAAAPKAAKPAADQEGVDGDIPF